MSDNELQKSEFIFYTSPNGDIKIEVFLADESIWLTQKKMAELFDVEVNTINYHLKEIFKSGELEENSVIRKIRITANDGKDYLNNFYNLDAIIAIGYRVNSKRATQFRIWATRVLKNYTIKDFAQSVDKFLDFNEYKILDGKGKISKDRADKKALEEYKKYNRHQRVESDFDKEVKRLKENRE
jgi:hypothetical protein